MSGRTDFIGGFQPFPVPGCDIFSSDLNLHLWQACWEARLVDAYAGREAAQTSRRSTFGPNSEGTKRMLSEDFSRQREGVIKMINESCGMVKHLLMMVETTTGRSAEEIWTRVLTREQREQLIMYAARDVCTLPSIGEGLRDYVPELQLYHLAADEGRRFWSIAQTLIAPPAEAEFSYPRVRYAPYDNYLAEGYSKETMPASRAMRAFQVWCLEQRHRFLSSFVARVFLHLHYNLRADRNIGRLIGAGDYVIKDDLDVQTGYSTRAPRERSAGPAPTLAEVAKQRANECTNCCKTSLEGENLMRCSACLTAGRKDIGYCSRACQKTDWKHHKVSTTPPTLRSPSVADLERTHQRICGKLATDNVDLPTFLSPSNSVIPRTTPLGLLRQIAAFEADPKLLWTVEGRPLHADFADLGWILDDVDKSMGLSNDNSAPSATEDARHAALESVEAAAMGDLAALTTIHRWMTFVGTVMTMSAVMDYAKAEEPKPELPLPAAFSLIVLGQFRQDFEFTTEVMEKLVHLR
ncbi:hypothetical protein RQP46_001767 [Phenoliferia psychrophenolica]